VVKGRITPDTYLFFKPTSALIEKKLGTKELKLVRDFEGENKEAEVAQSDRSRFVLDDKEVRQVAEYCIAIEKHYKAPMDIEWAKDDDGKIYIVQARAETVHSLRKNVMEVYELKETGTVLASGEAVGRKIGQGEVKVIEDPKDIVKFMPRQVLVADMTDPDWEPIMKVASAIVTNRGGRTCHAAIVSRELGIPCIIGTRDATKVLKDGQDVTVACAEGEGKVYRGLLRYERKEIDAGRIPVTRTKVYVNVGYRSRR